MSSFAACYSSYLKAEDVTKEGTNFKIVAAKEEKVGREDDAKKRAIIYFEDEPRGLVLNKTRFEAMKELFGSDDGDDWVGGVINVYRTKVQFGGKLVDATAVREATD